METISGFDKLGLSLRDSRVYIALVREGDSSIRKISDRTGLNRGSVYESIKTLEAAGLANHRKANINKKYFAENPEKILTLIDQRRDELDKIERESQETIIPELLKDVAYLPYSNIKFYEDDAGIASILKDVLATCEKLEEKEYRVISSKPLRKYIYDRFPNLAEQRVKKGIYVRVLAIGSGGTIDALSERKWLPDPPTRKPGSYYFIYGDKVAMIALNNSINPYGVVIENQGVAEMQKLLFEQLWNISESPDD